MHRHRPGPEPLFTHRLQMKIRTDQWKAIDSLASVLGMTNSELIRWILDHGIDAVQRSHNAVQEEFNAQS